MSHLRAIVTSSLHRHILTRSGHQFDLVLIYASNWTIFVTKSPKMRSPALRLAKGVYGNVQIRSYSSSIGGSKIRHFLSMNDFSREELTKLVQNAAAHKKAIKSGNTPKGLSTGLAGKTVAMMFNKRSTRTRVSTEAAVTLLGGHPMFLGKDDIQLGVRMYITYRD